MMDFEFRGWNGKKMVDVAEISFVSSTKIIWIGYDGERGEHPVEPLMMFINRKDKNGKKIYVGDILRYQKPYVAGGRFGNKIKASNQYVVVEWTDARGYNGFNVSSTKKAEVLGNIFENPVIPTY